MSQITSIILPFFALIALGWIGGKFKIVSADGMRGINGFEPGELNAGNLENAIEVFKRGKLTFLFEQFSLDREITALVLASPGPTKRG